MSGAESAGRRANLGRGLSSLLGDSGSADRPASVAGTRLVPIGQIRANPDQPRRYFNPDALAELSASIAAKGILQPILVRPDPAAEGDFQIIAGERRWRAAQQAGVHDVPVVVRQFDDTAVLEIALIENIQRADLDAIEEAAGYQRLIQDFGRSQDEIAKAVGKSRSHIANLMGLLTLPPAVQAMVIDGRLSAGHARALINAKPRLWSVMPAPGRLTGPARRPKSPPRSRTPIPGRWKRRLPRGSAWRPRSAMARTRVEA